MCIAPEPILRAGCDTVAWACIFVRNQTLLEEVPAKMINQTMEAIHAVPGMLTNWNPNALQAIRIHLRCFPTSQWPGAPDLIAYFEQMLKHYGYDENGA